MSKSTLAILSFAAATAFTGSALAQTQESGAYAGLSIGTSIVQDGCGGLPGGVSCEDKDFAWKIFGGYQFNRYIAAEAAYTDLGTVEASGLGITAEVKTNAWELVAVGSYPIGTSGFAPYGKLGFFRSESKGSSNVGVSATDTDNNWTAGLGVRWDITRNIAARAEWQRYNGDSDIDVFSIGALWKF